MEYLGQLTADDMQSPSGGGMQYLGMLAPPPVEGFTDPVGNKPGEPYVPPSASPVVPDPPQPEQPQRAEYKPWLQDWEQWEQTQIGELSTGTPHDMQNADALWSEFYASLPDGRRTDLRTYKLDDRQNQLLVDAQIAERNNAVKQSALDERLARMRESGMDPESYRMKERYERDMRNPSDRMLNFPVFRGLTQGAQTLASAPAELALRTFGEQDSADALARMRQDDANYSAYADQQQGKVASYVRQGADMLAKYLPAGVTGFGGVIAMVGTETQATKWHEGLQDGMSNAEAGGYAALHATKDMLLTYLGGKLANKLGGRTLEQALSGRGAGPLAEETFAQFAKRWAAGFAIEANVEEVPQYLFENAIDKFARTDYKPKSWEQVGRDVADIYAMTAIMQTAMGPLESRQDAVEFVNDPNPSRRTAERLGITEMLKSALDRRRVAKQAKPDVMAAASNKAAQETIDGLVAKYPELEQQFAGETGTPEYSSIREHTQAVLSSYLHGNGLSPGDAAGGTGDADIDAAMPTIIALHDIGKPDAIAAGDKGLQHEKTIPILQKVLRAEGHSEAVVDFATELIGNDIIGSVVKGQLSTADALLQLNNAAKKAGVSPQLLERAMNLFYKADAGSYAKLKDAIFTPEGEVADYNYRTYEETVHGVSRVPWTGEYRGADGGQGSGQADGSVVYRHSSARDFSQFDPNRDRHASNLAGPGAYLLPTGHEEVEAAYRQRAVEGVLRTVSKNLGEGVAKKVRAAAQKPGGLDPFIEQALAKQKSDPANAHRWGVVADALTALQQNSGGVTLNFEFAPQNTLDLGAWKSGGRRLSADEMSSLTAAAKSIDPNYTPPRTDRGVRFLRDMQSKLGHAKANQAIKAAGYDSIGFIHPGHQVWKTPSHPVVVALDHTAPKRVQSNARQAAQGTPNAPSPPNTPPQAAAPQQSTPNTPSPQDGGGQGVPPVPSSAAAGIAMPMPDIKIVAKKALHSAVKSYKKYFTSAAGNPDLVDNIIQEKKGFIRYHARKMKDLMGDMERAARKAYKVNPLKQPPASIAEDIQRALNDPKDALWKNAPLELAESMRRVRDHIDELSRFAAALPDIGPELTLTIEGNLGTYTTRTYRKFDEKGWRSQALGDKDIMDAFAAEVRRTSPKATDAEIRTLAEILLDAKTLDLSDVGGNGSSLVNVLKKRKDIPDAVRALYGERKDAFQNYERTVGAVAKLVGDRHAAASLRTAGLQGGIFWPDAASTPPGSDAVQFDSQTQGTPPLAALDGLVMNRDVRDAIVDAHKSAPMNKWYGAIVGVSGLAKAAKTVGSFQSGLRNFWGNVPMFVANGEWDIKAVARAAAAVQGGDTFGLRKGNREHQKYMQRMSRLGLLEDVSMAQLRDIAKSLTASVESYLGGVDPGNLIKRGMRKGSAWYQGMDSIFKIAQFESMRPRYAKAYPGMSENELDAYVAKIVRNTLPTYSNASKAARAISKFPLAGPFAIFSFEVLRTSANRARLTAQELRSDNPVLRRMGARKLAGQLVAYSGAYAVAEMTKMMFGVTDEEDEALHKLAPPWQRYTDWIYTGRQKDGVADYLDYGYMNPFGVFMDPINAASQGNFRDAAKQFAEPLVGEDLAGGAFLSIWRGRDDKGAPVYDEGLDEPQQLKQMLDFVYNRFEPGTLSSMRRISKGYNDETSSGGKKYDFWRELASFGTGVRLDEFSIEQSAKWRHGAFAKTINAAGRAVTKRFGSEETQTLDELAEVYRSADRVRRRAFKEWRGLMTDLEVLGIDDPLRSAAERGAGSAKLRRMVYAEQYEPYLPSNSTMRSWKQRLPDADERIALLGQLYEESLQQDQQ